MRFIAKFENSNDHIPFEVKHNHDLIEWFIRKADAEEHNKFFNNDDLDREIDQKLNDNNWALSKTNEIYWLLTWAGKLTLSCDTFFPVIFKGGKPFCSA